MSSRRPPQQVDVAVVGGGAAGVAAALGAAACGARVALIEAYGFLGGTATVAGVQSYCGFHTRGAEPIQVVAGVGQRILSSVSKHLIGRFFVALRKEFEASAKAVG